MSKKNASLIRGVGVVMDDHVLDEIVQEVEQSLCSTLKKIHSYSEKRQLDQIVKITRVLEDYGLPLVKCKDVPLNVDRFVDNLGSVAFLLMDWRYDSSPLIDVDGAEGALPRSQELKSQKQKDVVEFIKKFMELCTAPIFIVSNESTDAIKRSLVECLGEGIASRIIVEPKASLATRVIGAIEKWIQMSPSTYVLKMWDNAYQDARHKMFKEFSCISQFWPVPLYKAYKKDGDDPSSALTELLFRNLRGRMGNLSLVKSRFRTGARKPGREVLRKIIETSVVVPDEYLNEGQFGCGDLFHKREKKNGKWKERYWLLISCDCDCIDHSSQDATTGGGADVALLPASIVSNSALKKRTVFNPAYGFDQPKDRAYLFPVNGGKGLCLLFSKMAMKSINSLLADGYERIGRVCAPYITDVRQRNAQWLQREGFPKIPVEAVR